MEQRIAKYSFIGSLFLGLVFAVCGIVGFVNSLSLVIRCSQKTEAVVLDYYVEISHDDDGDSRSYYPIFEYYYNDLRYVGQSAVSDFIFKKYTVGEHTVVHFNPDNPEEVYGNTNWVIFIFEIVFAAVGIFVMFNAVKIYHEYKKSNKKKLSSE